MKKCTIFLNLRQWNWVAQFNYMCSVFAVFDIWVVKSIVLIGGPNIEGYSVCPVVYSVVTLAKLLVSLPKLITFHSSVPSETI